MLKVFELKRKRANLVDKARAEIEALTKVSEADVATGAEYRSLSAEDKAKVDKMLDECTSLDELIERLEKIETASGTPEMNEAEMDGDKACPPPAEKNSRGRRTDPVELTRRAAPKNVAEVYESKEYRNAFLGYCKHGNLILPAEYRDMTLGTSSAGGYLVTPTQISKNVIMQMNNLVFLRALATVETVTTAQSLGVRQITTQPSDAAWTTEIGSISADTAMAFGRRDLTPNLLTKLINISIRLDQAADDAERLIQDRLAYKFAVAEENAFLNGTGSSQPLGCFTASANGIPTTQDYVVTDTTPLLVADNMVSAKYQLKQQYLGDTTVRWVFNRFWVNQLRTLKDTNNRYLWFDGASYSTLDKPAPPTFDGIAMAISEYAPNSIAAGGYCGLLGAFKYYQIADVRQMEIQRLVELYAGTSEIGFLGRRWLDGSPVLGEAFVRLKVHS